MHRQAHFYIPEPVHHRGFPFRRFGPFLTWKEDQARFSAAGFSITACDYNNAVLMLDGVCLVETEDADVSAEQHVLALLDAPASVLEWALVRHGSPRVGPLKAPAGCRLEKHK